MAIKFSNRKDEIYYIKSKKTKKGNLSYYMTRKRDKECLKMLPEGYEVFEKYDTGVTFIRKIKKREFTVNELKTLERELRKNKEIVDYKIDINGNIIRIYIAEKGYNRMEEFFEPLLRSPNMIQALQEKFKRFEEKMRILLKTKKDYREFEIQRYCYRGSVDDWISIDGGETLESLVKEYVYHLGRESYYNMI